MNREALRTLLLELDPKMTQGFAFGQGEAYGYWDWTSQSSEMSDDRTELRLITVQVHRFTKDGDDEWMFRLARRLEELDIPTDEVVWTYEPDEGYWHFVLTVFLMEE